MSLYIPDSLRNYVKERANLRCEYCLIREEDSFLSFQIDHITETDNLAWSCFTCNNNKDSDIATVLLPSAQLVRLFNPRIDSWQEHFEYDEGLLRPKSLIVEATIKLLKINDIDRVIERQAIGY